MKNLLFSIIILFGMQSVVHSTVWRVNNLPGTNAHFTTLQAAHNSASVLAGDTLHLEASSGSYGDLTATKMLVIIGAGYFLSENQNLQSNFNSSVVGNITFNAGSNGSILIGCTTGKITINSSDLLIEKNYILGPSGNRVIEFLGSQNNIIIRMNYILGGTYSSSVGANPGGIQCLNTANNVYIINNYLLRRHGTYIILTGTSFSGIIENNIIDGGNTTLNNSVFNNNIMIEGSFNQTNSQYNNNIGNSTQFGTTDGNQSNVNMADVFVGATGNSTDGQWQLKPGSPAIGAGVGGVDCGMFGGTYPYKLSGIPDIPTIYFHEQVIDNVNQELNVTIKAKSQN